jgi:hypothetical protein
MDKIADCYGDPFTYPGDTYPGWPPGTLPDETQFVQGGKPSDPHTDPSQFQTVPSDGD